jgi:hypothetical protein
VKNIRLFGYVLIMTSFCALAGCVGTTGGDLVTFDAFAAGPEDAVSGEPIAFENSRGYAVSLTRARLHVGAVYLNRSRVNSVGSETGCFLPGIYVAEVTSGLDVDVLSSELQPFPGLGSGTTDRALTAEVWLFGGGDIDEVDDSTVILDVAGTASKDGVSYPFEGGVTIAENRLVEPPSRAQPGANPICKQRIVSPIAVDVTIARGESLVLRVDPRGFFANVDFSELASAGGDPPVFRFDDGGGDPASQALYGGLRSASGVYDVLFEELE